MNLTISNKNKTLTPILVVFLALVTGFASWFVFDRFTAPNFHREVPVQKLAAPVDFAKVVYPEVDHTVDMSFWLGFDGWLGKARYFSHVGAALENTKTFYKIECDWAKQTAIVTRRATGKPLPDLPDLAADMKDSVQTYTMICANQSGNLCLLHVFSSGVADIISMDSEIGSFVDTICNDRVLTEYNDTTIWYGSCRN